MVRARRTRRMQLLHPFEEVEVATRHVTQEGVIRDLDSSGTGTNPIVIIRRRMDRISRSRRASMGTSSAATSTQVGLDM